MHYMEGVGDDQLSFAIWTGSDPDAAIFTMTASSAEKKKDWLQALKKLRESQHAFAIGKENLKIEQRLKSLVLEKFMNGLLFGDVRQKCR